MVDGVGEAVFFEETGETMQIRGTENDFNFLERVHGVGESRADDGAYREFVERETEENVEREGEREGHGHVDTRVGFGNGDAQCGRDRDVARTGAKNDEEKRVAVGEAEQAGGGEAEGGVGERDQHREGGEKRAGAAQIAQAPDRDDAHVEEEQREDTGEKVLRERLEGGGTGLVAGDGADQQTAEEEEN